MVHMDSRGDRGQTSGLGASQGAWTLSQIGPSFSDWVTTRVGRTRRHRTNKALCPRGQTTTDLQQELNKNIIFTLKQPTLGKKQSPVHFQYKTQDFKNIPTRGGWGWFGGKV